MSLFAIADLHLSLGADKPMDIFGGWENYVEKLTDNWKKIITDADVVVLPGDLSWALKLEETAKDFSFLHGLPGKKLLLKGNHDLWWCTMRKMEAFFAEQGFDSLQFVHNNCYPMGDYAVCGTRGWFFDDTESNQKVLLREAGRLETSIAAAEALGLIPIVFLHYPPVYNGQVCHEIFDILKAHQVRHCYYGHIHGPAAVYATQGDVEGVHLHLIAGDYLKFVPKLVPLGPEMSSG